MKKQIELPPTLSEAEKVEYLRIAAEYWKNYFSVLENFVEKRNATGKVER